MKDSAKGILGPKAGETQNANKIGNGLVRTTILVPKTLHENWEVLAVMRKKGKNDILVDALATFIDGAGMNPDKSPKLSVTY